MGDRTEEWKIGTVGGKDDVVGWVEGDLVATVGGSIVGLGRVDSEHVRRHLRREVVDHDGELLREGWRRWERSWFDTPEDLVHAEVRVSTYRERRRLSTYSGPRAASP